MMNKKKKKERERERKREKERERERKREKERERERRREIQGKRDGLTFDMYFLDTMFFVFRLTGWNKGLRAAGMVA
jgi:hypothetical protein